MLYICMCVCVCVIMGAFIYVCGCVFGRLGLAYLFAYVSCGQSKSSMDPQVWTDRVSPGEYFLWALKRVNVHCYLMYIRTVLPVKCRACVAYIGCSVYKRFRDDISKDEMSMDEMSLPLARGKGTCSLTCNEAFLSDQQVASRHSSNSRAAVHWTVIPAAAVLQHLTNPAAEATAITAASTGADQRYK